MRAFIVIFILLNALLIQGQDALFNQFNTENGLPSNHIYSAFEDEQGRIWFSTQEGLSVLEGFSFRTLPKNGESIIVGFQRSASGEIWSYDGAGGIYQFREGSFQNIALNDKIRAKLGNNITNAIAIDSEQNIWISTIIGGELYRIDAAHLRIDDLSGQLQECNYWIKSVESGVYILGSKNESKGDDATLTVDLETQSFEIPLSGKGGYSKSRFLKLDDGSFLFSAGSELVAFDESAVHARLFTEKNISAIHQDGEGKIWIGLNQGGLLCFPTGEVSSRNRIEYLGNISITDIFEDSQNNLWITTDGGGAFSYNLNPTLVYETPKLSEKVDTNHPRQHQAIRLDQDPNMLTLERVFWDTIAPEVFISAIEINNSDTLLLGRYELDANQNFLKIGFVGSLPGNPGLFQYRYRMNGVDQDWVYSSLNSVSYTMLPPGEYSFYVDAMSKEGIWSEQPAIVNFVIHPHFYQTYWFQLTAIAGIALIVVLLIYFYISYIRSKESEKAAINQRIADLELMALRAQMNPHFLFNTLSSIQHFVSANHTDEALRYLSKFAKLMRVVLDNSKRKEIPINDEIRAISLYLDLEKLRFKDKFEYTIQIGDELDPSYDEIPSMLIQPYLENAILHGINNKKEKGQISVKLSLEDDNIVCTIEDDGVGRKKAAAMQKKSKAHKSQGMNITRDRLSIINRVNQSDLSVVVEDIFDAENTGTRVKIFVPFKNY